MKSIDGILASSPVHVRWLASAVRQIISMSLAIGQVTHLRTRALYAMINSRQSWADRLHLSKDAREDLVFWKSCLSCFNGRPIWFSPGVTRIVYSDASSFGYGGYHEVEVGLEVVHRQWSEFEASLSSTWRELKAVSLVLCALASKLSGHSVKWFTDNQNVVHIVECGSMKQHLQLLAPNIFEVCFRHNICLYMEWIPHMLNDKADYISRIRDLDGWKVNPQFFLWIDGLWGRHTVDRFAHIDNTQLPVFNSRFWCPGSSAVDAFTVNWSDEVNWWVPPVHLVSRMLQHAKVCKAMGTPIVPAWKSASYWPLLCPDGSHLAQFVHECMLIPYFEALFLHGKSGNNIGDSLKSDSIVLCLWLDFSAPPRIGNYVFFL